MPVINKKIFLCLFLSSIIIYKTIYIISCLLIRHHNFIIRMSQTKHILMSSEFGSGSALAACILNAHPEVSFSTDVIKYWRFSYDRYLGSNKNSTTHILKEIARRIHLKFSINLNIEECLDQIGNNFNHKYIYTVVNKILNNNNIENKVIGENETLSWKYIPYFLENIPDIRQ